MGCVHELGAANDPDTHIFSENFFERGAGSPPATSADHLRLCQFSGVLALQQ
jgi:hypothetical protein